MSAAGQRYSAKDQTLRCSIVIPVYNRAGLTKHCVDLLLADTSTEAEHEIVVVDDSSTDDTPKLLSRYGDAIRVVRHDTNTGFATACNDGAAAAAGEYLVFLNNDTLPLEGWLDALVAYADRQPNAAVVGSKMLFPDDTIQHAGVVITEDLNPRHIYAGFPADHPAVSKSRRYPIVTAGCALFRRDTFELAGGFDDAFVNGFEDVDLCLRLGELGYEVHYCADAVLYHLEMGTRHLQEDAANHRLYWRRWAHRVRPDAVSRYIEDGLLKMTFSERYPFSLEVSPLLALIERHGAEDEVDRLLSEQVRDMVDLSRENVLLSLELANAGLARPTITRRSASDRRAQEPKALYFVSDAPGDSMRYRCDHHAEELELLGATTRVDRFELSDLGVESLTSTGVFVLHRVPLNEGVEWFIEAARERGRTVLFDTDALVSESRASDRLDLSTMPGLDREALGERQEQLSKTIAMCDAVLVPTEPLADSALELNPNVYVIANAANKEMLELSSKALANRVKTPNSARDITMAYFSETPTHDSDYLFAADAVRWALENDPRCRLLTVGNVALDSRFDRHRDRITAVAVQPWQRLPGFLADVDINVSPLEADNPLTESRSCLNYVRAALVGVPTIASPRPDFVRAIDPGRNGLLAETSEEWREAIGQLLESSELRARLGQAAYEDVRERHTTLALAPRLFETLASIAGDRNTRTLVVDFVADRASLTPQRSTSVALLVNHLRERMHTVRTLFEGERISERESTEVELADVAVALDAVSATKLARRPDALFRLFLVDDDEAQRLSDQQLKSLLELPLRPIALDERLASRLSTLRGMRVDWLPPPVDAARFERILRDCCFARATSFSPADS